MKLGRIIVAVFLLLLAAAAGVTVYYQGQTARQLRTAMDVAKDYPQRAYVELQGVRSYGDLRTFGEASRAMHELSMELYGNSVRRLMSPKVEPSAYLYALNTLGVMQTMKNEGFEGLDPKMASILKAARDSVDRIADHGSYGAWREMITFFETLADRNFMVPESVIEDYDAWLADLKRRNQEEAPVIYLRDVRQQVVRGKEESRDLLGFDAANMVARTVLPLPADLAEDTSLTLDEGLRRHLEEIDTYERGYGHYSTGTLELTKAFLNYNRAAVMGAHLLDRGRVIRRMGSSFVSQRVLLSPNAANLRYIPPPDELVDSFLDLALERLRLAEDSLLLADKAQTEVAGLMALRYRLEMDLLPAGSVAREDAAILMEEWAAMTNSDYREALAAAPGRPLFLLRIPNESEPPT